MDIDQSIAGMVKGTHDALPGQRALLHVPVFRLMHCVNPQ